MWPKLLLGLAGLLGIYLLIRNLFKSDKPADKIQEAFNDEFDSSEYKAAKQNWIDVSRMETAGWTSSLFLNGLNLWGMKKAKKRPNTQLSFTQEGEAGRDSGFFAKYFPNINQLFTQGVKNYVTTPISTGTQSDWAKYKNLNDAVKDIILWMEYTKFPKEKISLRDHVEAMKARGYFAGEDVAEYLGKIVAWKNRDLS